MTFSDKLNKLAASYEESEAKTGSDRAPLPDGKYQATLTKVHLAEVKKGKMAGSVRVEFHGKILLGEFKGYPIWRGVNLEMEAKGNFPSGVSLLKGDLQTLGATLTSLDEASLVKVFKGLIGQNVEVSARNKDGWTNIYFNQLIGEINLKGADLAATAPMDISTLEDVFADDQTEDMDEAPQVKPEPKRRGRPKGSKNKRDPVDETPEKAQSIAAGIGAVDQSDEFGPGWGND